MVGCGLKGALGALRPTYQTQPYHTQLLRTTYHTPTISYQRLHSILTLYFSQVQHSKRITHSFQGRPLVSDCSKIWCLQSDSPWCWSVFPLGEEHSSHLGWWPWPGLGSHIEIPWLKIKWFFLIFYFEWFFLIVLVRVIDGRCWADATWTEWAKQR